MDAEKGWYAIRDRLLDNITKDFQVAVAQRGHWTDMLSVSTHRAYTVNRAGDHRVGRI